MSDELRDTLVETAAQGRAFLKRQIIRLSGISNFEYSCADSSQIFFVQATAPDKDRSQVYVRAGYGDDKFPNDFTFWKINVSGNFKGKGLGLAAVKATLGLAYEKSAPAIFLSTVRDDGPEFWPLLGAVPLYEPVTLATEIDEALKRNAAVLPPGSDAYEEISRIRDTAKKNPYLGFRELARCNVMLPSRKLPDGFPFRSIVFKHLCENTDMVIIPSEPDTRLMLHDKLGEIPVFPPFKSKDHPTCAKICAALAGNGGASAPFIGQRASAG